VTGPAAPVASQERAFEFVIIFVLLVDSGYLRAGQPQSFALPTSEEAIRPSGIEGKGRGDSMLFDRQRFVLAVHQALIEHDKEKDKATDSGGHNIAIDCDHELEAFADRILELME
jgi:hypothetical protein